VRNFNYVPVSLNNGVCPNAEHHFRGAAREVYSYLKLLAANHGGFVFAGIGNIAEHTKNWKDQPFQYSYRQCKRIIKAFRALGILSERQAVKIKGRTRRGWQFVDHVFWAESYGHYCDFKRWEEYEASYQQHKQHNVPIDVPDVDPLDVPKNRIDVPIDVPA
jgi:hypothetical protein